MTWQLYSEEYFEKTNAIEEVEQAHENDGFVDEGDVSRALDEVYKLASAWLGDGSVAAVERSESGVAMQFSSGIWYLYSPKRREKTLTHGDVEG